MGLLSRFSFSHRNSVLERIMIRKTLTILSLIGLLLSVGLWGVSELQRGIPWKWYFSTPPSLYACLRQVS